MKTYQSKLAPGQTAWFMQNNKVVSKPVGTVTIRSVVDEKGNPSHETIDYSFRAYKATSDFEPWDTLSEKVCFASKEELLASL